MHDRHLQQAMTAISDELERDHVARLVAVSPHYAAENAVIATVESSGGVSPLTLRALAERVYQQAGTLVLFRLA